MQRTRVRPRPSLFPARGRVAPRAAGLILPEPTEHCGRIDYRQRRVLKGNREDRVLSVMRDAGLVDPKTVSYGRMFFSLRTAYYQASVARP